MRDVLSAATPGVLLALFALTFVLLRGEPRRWTGVERKYKAPVWYAVAVPMCVCGIFLLRSAPVRPGPASLTGVLVGCAYVILAAFLPWNTWWHTRRRA
jgi:hypothetical protein